MVNQIKQEIYGIADIARATAYKEGKCIIDGHGQTPANEEMLAKLKELGIIEQMPFVPLKSFVGVIDAEAVISEATNKDSRLWKLLNTLTKPDMTPKTQELIEKLVNEKEYPTLMAKDGEIVETSKEEYRDYLTSTGKHTRADVLILDAMSDPLSYIASLESEIHAINESLKGYQTSEQLREGTQALVSLKSKLKKAKKATGIR